MRVGGGGRLASLLYAGGASAAVSQRGHAVSLHITVGFRRLNSHTMTSSTGNMA